MLGRFLCTFWVLLQFCASAHADIRFSVDELRGWMEDFQSGASLTQNERSDLSHYRFVLVHGYLNEVLTGYFHDIREHLEELGVPSEQIHTVSPPSANSAAADLKMMADSLEEFSSRGPQKIVLFGHSKGAAAAVAFSLKNPQWVEEKIEAVIAVQGVFGGSGIADHLYHREPSKRKELPTHIQGFGAHFFPTAARVLRPLVSLGAACGYFQGLASLTHTQNSAHWENLRKECASAIPRVANKIIFIRTEQKPGEQVWLLRPLATFLESAYGSSDGLVQVSEQYLPWIQPSCPVLLSTANHLSLTHRGWMSNSTKEFRRSFLLALGRGLVR